jgi:plasmid stability protein
MELFMPNITVRNIPDQLLNKLRILSVLEKRSLNSEILMILEKGLAKESKSVINLKKYLSNDTQIKMWENLCGKWKDSRSTAEIISDIIDSRSEGRSVDL